MTERVLWRGPWRQPGSYGQATRDWVRLLAGRGVRVALDESAPPHGEATGIAPEDEAALRLLESCGSPIGAVRVRHGGGSPDSRSRRNILFTTWDATTPPPERWVRRLHGWDVACVPSAACAELVRSADPPVPVEVVPHVVAADRLRAGAGRWSVRSDGGLRALYVGDLSWRKGAREAIDGFLMGAPAGSSLRVVGTGKVPPGEFVRSSAWWRSDVSVLCAWRPLHEGEVAALYHVVDLVLCPSRGEAFGLVPWEAAVAAGVPAVVSAAHPSPPPGSIVIPDLGTEASPDADVDAPRGVFAGIRYARVTAEAVADAVRAFVPRVRDPVLPPHAPDEVVGAMVRALGITA